MAGASIRTPGQEGVGTNPLQLFVQPLGHAEQARGVLGIVAQLSIRESEQDWRLHTERICRAALSDTRVRYERSEVNRGATWNYNRLVDLASAPLFKWAAHDDLLAPSFIRACVEELDRAPHVVLAYPRTILIDHDGQIIDAEFEDGLDLRDEDPLTRFRRYLVHPGEQHPIFGVIRTEPLRQTGLIANCWGGDQVVLASLLLQAPIREVSDRLFLRRYHPGTSLAANASPAEVARWYDPTKRGRTALPRTRLTVELAGVALRADLPLTTRLRCVMAVATDWTPRYWRVMAGEVRRTVRAAVRERRSRRSNFDRQGALS